MLLTRDMRLQFLRGLALLLVVGACISALFQLGQPTFPFDDAFISFRYADNLVRGRGLTYNPGEPVEGYTNFLWVLLVAAGMSFGFDPLHVAGALGSVAFLATLAFTASVIVRTSDGRLRTVIGLLCLVWLLSPRDFVPFAKCGLETMLVAALVIGLGLSAHTGQAGEVVAPEGWRSGVPHSLLPAALMLTRLDGAVFVLVSAFLTTMSSLRRHLTEGLPCALRRTTLGLAQRYWLLGAILLGWLVFKLGYYGDLLPNTYYAKAADGWSWEAGGLYLFAFAKSYPHSLALFALAAVAATLGTTRAARSFGLFALGSLTLFAVYVAKVGGDFMHYRFAFEAYPLLVAAAGVGVVTLTRRSPFVALGTALAVTVISPGEPVMEERFTMQDLGTMRKFYQDGSRSGPLLGKVTPPETVISTSLAGTIAYFSDRRTIDELGLNDRHVAHQRGTIHSRGHVKRASQEYLVEQGVNLQLTHPWDVPCTRQNRDRTKRDRPPRVPLVWLKIDRGDCVRMEYVVQTPALTRWFCNHPEWFVVDDLTCR